MIVEIVDFEAGHLDQMDMRDHEAGKEINGESLRISSIESKTVLIDGEILCSYGLFDNHGLWQIPSKNISTITMKYARETIKIVREMIKGKEGVHSVCLDDEFHKRWMKFLGLKPTKQTYEIEG